MTEILDIEKDVKSQVIHPSFQSWYLLKTRQNSRLASPASIPIYRNTAFSVINLLSAQSNPSHLKCNVFGAFLFKINTVYCWFKCSCMCFRFSDKRKAFATYSYYNQYNASALITPQTAFPIIMRVCVSDFR